MPLQRGEVRGYDFNRMVLELTMLNEGKVILCAVSTAVMDDLEGSRNVKPDQFARLREVIEERASRKFFEEQRSADRPVDYVKRGTTALRGFRPRWRLVSATRFGV